MTETPTPDESRTERLSRQGRRAYVSASTVAIVVALVVLIGLIVDNTKKVRVGYVFGETHSSLIWVIVLSGLAGWCAGIATAVLYRRRTRRGRRA